MVRRRTKRVACSKASLQRSLRACNVKTGKIKTLKKATKRKVGTYSFTIKKHSKRKSRK